MSEKQEPAGDLSAEEQAYFESGGEAELPEAATTQEDVDAGAEQEREAAGKAKEGGGEADKPQDEKSKTVPHQALHAEREEHKKTRSELNEMREKWARLEERMQMFAAQKPQEKEEAAPDPNEDVFGALMYERQKREALEKQFNETAQQAQERQQAQQQVRTAFGHLNQSIEVARQTTPDIDEASNWLYGLRKSQLKAAGMDDFSAEQHIQQEVYGGIITALQRGMDPAAYFYEYAKASGYTRKESSDAGKEAAEKIQKIAKAQDASKTIGQTSGKAGGDEITPEALAGMSDSEFSAWIDKPENARKFEQIMGG